MSSFTEKTQHAKEMTAESINAPFSLCRMASATDNESDRKEIASDVKRYHFPVEDIPRLSCLDPEVERLIKNEVITAFYHFSCFCYWYCWKTWFRRIIRKGTPLLS